MCLSEHLCIVDVCNSVIHSIIMYNSLHSRLHAPHSCRSCAWPLILSVNTLQLAPKKVCCTICQFPMYPGVQLLHTLHTVHILYYTQYLQYIHIHSTHNTYIYCITHSTFSIIYIYIVHIIHTLHAYIQSIQYIQCICVGYNHFTKMHICMCSILPVYTYVCT